MYHKIQGKTTWILKAYMKRVNIKVRFKKKKEKIVGYSVVNRPMDWEIRSIEAVESVMTRVI